MDYLSDRQIALLIFGAVVGYGVLSLPKETAEVAGTGGWITLIFATILASLVTYVFLRLGKIFNDKTIAEYSPILIGKFFTKVILLVYAFYFFMIFTFITRAICEVIKYSILIRTPVWALMSLLLIIAFYLVTKGLRGVARLCEIYGLIIIPGYLIIHTLMLSQGKFINLRPFFEASDVPQYLKGILQLTFPFLGIEILTFVPINKQSNQKVVQSSLLLIAIIGVLYIFVVESCIALVGVDDIIHYRDALIHAMRMIDIPFLEFLRRLDGIVLSLWIMAVFCTISVLAYGTTFNLHKLFQKFEFNFLAFCVIVAAFVVGQIPQTYFSLEKIMEYTSFLGIGTSIIIPFGLLILTKVKQYE